MGVTSGYPSSLSPLIIFGTLLALYGIYFRCSAYRALGRHFTFHVSLKEDHSLIQEWPYSVVRHPSYTGSYIVVLGYALTMAAPDSWLRTIALPQLFRHGGVASVLMAVVFIRAAVHYVLVTKMIFDRTRSEDALLQKRFGQQWDSWASDVPYRLIPGVY
jgi:protein-S-isoprenylcysteine O-methyltransferase Ste14